METMPHPEGAPALAYECATANSADIAALIELEATAAGEHTYSAITTETEALEELEKCVVYFVKRGGDTVASVAYELKSPEHGYISGLVVRPEFQGQGIAREAMRKVLNELRDVSRIDLVTHPENERAIALYESLGFEKGETTDNYFGDGEPRMLMSLRREK